jgi:mono/diheme cytochrome c family protein
MPTIALASSLLLLAAGVARGADRAECNGLSVPVALAWGPEGRLFVALRDGWGLAAVEPGTWRVAARWPLGLRPASLAAADDGATLLVGGMDGECVAVRDGRVVRRLEPGSGPTRVLPLPGGRVVAASRWDDAVRLLDWREGRVLATHRLGFPTGAMVRTPEGRVVVADAFGGRLTELIPGTIGSERSLMLEGGVNLHALAVSGDGRELLIAHMFQDRPMPLTRTNLDWGQVYSSKLSALRLTEFGATGRPINVRRLTLDGSGHGAADPSALAVSPDGNTLVIALAGAQQVLKVDRTQGTRVSPDLLPLGDSQRIVDREVGRNPVALVLDPSGTFAVTADALADTLTVLRLDDLAPIATVPLGAPGDRPTAVQRGEAWFRDGRSAMDRWMSCASCHTDGHTVGLNFDTGGDGGYGAAKNIPSLLGCGPTAPYAWTGRFPRLEDQVAQSLDTSLHGPGPAAGQVEDMIAYLRSLPPAPPRRPADDPAARRGAAVFRARRCDSCHAPPDYTRPILRDVDLDDGDAGHRRFNPPSLRGVSRSAPYLHDGRSRTLRDVLGVHHPGTARPFAPDEAADLAAFLESL